MSDELIESVLKWWNEHQYDVTGDYGDYNVYNDEPEFVKIAMKLKKEQENND